MAFWVGMNVGFLQTHEFYPQKYIFDRPKIKNAIFIAYLAKTKRQNKNKTRQKQKLVDEVPVFLPILYHAFE